MGYSLRTTSLQFFIFILDLKDSEKLGVTFRTHSFLLENLKKVLKNHNFFEKIKKYVFAHIIEVDIFLYQMKALFI